MERKKRRNFTPEFRREAVRMVVEGGSSVAGAARDLGISAGSLHQWIRQHKIDHSPNESGELTTVERKELRKLRAKVRELEMERAILKKATVFFAKESE